MIICVPVYITDSTVSSGNNAKTGLTPTILAGYLMATPATAVPSGNYPTILAAGAGLYYFFFDPEANGEASFQVDAGSSLSASADRFFAIVFTRDSSRLISGVNSSGQVTVGTNNDKTGYTLASFGFSVTVGTNSDKTGYALSSGGVTAVQSGLSTYAGGAVASVTAPVTVGTNEDKTGYALSSAGLDTITLETGINGRQGLAVIYDACSQAITGNGTSTVTVKSPSGATRIVATMSGLDRASTVVTPPA